MNEFLVWFSSPLGVAIAWLCSISGFIFSIVQVMEKSKLSLELKNIESIKNTLKVKCQNLEAQNIELEQKIIRIQNSSTHGNTQKLSQEGGTNINAGVLNGDFNFNQSDR